MAAGQGKRMQDPTKPKVLYELAGTPLIGHVLDLCSKLDADRIICILGYGREQVGQYLAFQYPLILTAIQEQQLGTGHAVMQTDRQLQDFDGDVLILSGDVPLLTRQTVDTLLETHRERVASATVLAVTMPDPTGYGRIVRTVTGSLDSIVEERDATEEQKKIKEINTGIYVFDARTLRDVLPRLGRENAQGEYYLTDAFSLLRQQFGLGSLAVAVTSDPMEVSGVNTKLQLETLEAEYLKRQKSK